jgi:hypothetical protein
VFCELKVESAVARVESDETRLAAELALEVVEVPSEVSAVFIVLKYPEKVVRAPERFVFTRVFSEPKYPLSVVVRSVPKVERSLAKVVRSLDRLESIAEKFVFT